MGSRIRELRLEHRLTGRKLAELAGVTPAFISQIELGQVMPSLSAVLRIADVLGTTLGYLFDPARPPANRLLHPDDWEIFQYPGDISEGAILALDRQRRF